MHVKKLFVVFCTLILFTTTSQPALSETFFLRDVIWSSSGDLLVLGHEDMVCIHETENFESVLAINDLDVQISAMALDSDRGQLITGHLDGTINFWDLEEGTVVETANFYGLPIGDIEINGDGTRLAITTRDERQTELWERDTLTVQTRLMEQMSCKLCKNSVTDIEFSSDNQFLALLSGDFLQDDFEIIAAIWIWDLQSSDEVNILEYPEDRNLGFAYGFTSLDFSTDGRYIIASENRGGVLLWNIESGKYLGRTIVAGEDGYAIGRFSPSNNVLATGASQLQVGNIALEETGLQISEPTIDHKTRGSMRDMAFNPDGKKLATLNLQNQVVIWDIETGTQVADFPMCGDE